MKNVYKTVFTNTLLAIVCTHFAATASAAGGKINFTGSIVNASCTLGTSNTPISSQSGDISIDFGKVAIEDLTRQVAGTAVTTVNMNLNCPGVSNTLTGVSVTFDPMSGSGIDSNDSRLLKLNTAGSPAKGVGIAIVNAANDIIDLSGNETISAPLTVDDNGVGTANLSLRAAYVRSSDSITPTAGDANATLPFTITYQ